MKKEPGKTKVVLTAALFVCIALALNLTVAWACAAWSPLKHNTKLPEHKGSGYPDTWPGGPYEEEGWWQTRRGFGFAQWTSLHARGAEGNFAYFTGGTILYRRAGWPLLSFQSIVQPNDSSAPLHSARRWNLPPAVILKRGMPTNDLPGFLNAHSERRLPVMPIWSGLFLNTAFYTVLIFGILKLRKIRTNHAT